MRKKKRILVADDDVAILDVVELMLVEEGYEVETIADGESLFNIQQNPDLILLDISMSGFDGRDICKHIKSKEHTKYIPIIIMSANRDTQIIAAEAGADDFLAKPFEMNFFLEKVKNYTSK
ncbi:hypothetical protein BH09PAT2_BH09PAT2_03110 [soil metagenome]